MAELSPDFVERYRERYEAGDCPLFESMNGLGYVVYKRTYARPVAGEERTEEWWETCQRVVNGALALGVDYNEDEAQRQYDHMYNLRGLPAGRSLWQLGTENNKRLGGDSLVNCWFVDIRDPEDFGFLFEELMLGGGVGFGITRAKELGRVKSGAAECREGFDVDFIVPDNREGWAQLVVRVIDAHLSGESFTYSVDAIRPEGAPINTFGGVASGPGILVRGIDQIQDILRRRQGDFVQPIDVLDIGNIIGSVVVSGNVRRSAQIALGSPDDEAFLAAKNWESGTVPSWRAMSNNSVYVQNPEELSARFWDGYDGSGEPYGLVNLDLLRTEGRLAEVKLDSSIAGVNPCAEIGLASYESCNLAELVLPRIDSLEQMQDIARLLYKLQKAIAAMPYLHRRTEEIVHRNMRLGLSVTGVAQARNKLEWLSPTYEYLSEVDRTYSWMNGYPTSVKLTTVKPSGTLSLLAGVTPGAHPGFSRYHIRRVRMSSNDPLVQWCRDQGYRTEHQRGFDGEEDHRTVVIEFPVKLPEDTWFADEATAMDQMDMHQLLQREWSDNAVSITVYFREGELDEIRDRVVDDWDKIKTISFLPYNDHGFDQAPLESISQGKYREMVEALDRGRNTTASGVSSLFVDDSECTTGACPIR